MQYNKLLSKTVANLLALELSNQGIYYIDDCILDASAEYIIEMYCDSTKLEDITTLIRQYIRDTQSNYPKYFSTGQEY